MLILLASILSPHASIRLTLDSFLLSSWLYRIPPIPIYIQVYISRDFGKVRFPHSTIRLQRYKKKMTYTSAHAIFMYKNVKNTRFAAI